MGTATTSRSALLTWDPPLPEEQNGIIINYIINVTEADSGVSFQLFSANTSLLVESLLPFTSYNLLIAASTSVGTGPFSRLLTLQTLQDGRCIILIIFIIPNSLAYWHCFPYFLVQKCLLLKSDTCYYLDEG